MVTLALALSAALDSAKAQAVAPKSPLDGVVPGVSIRLGDTNFYQGVAAGSGDHGTQFGGKVDALVTVDLGGLGVWTGLSLVGHGDYNYGRNVNGQAGTLLPVNTALTFPGEGGRSADLSSLYLSQQFGTTGNVSIGKFNMLDQAVKTPLRGGGGADTFQNIGLAAPVTGLVPPYLYGAIGSLRTDLAILTVIVFDPQSAVRSGPNRLFENGVNVLGAVTVPIAPFGLTGYQGVKFVGSTRKSVDLRDVPELILPSSTPQMLRGSRTPWFVSYSFQQYLIQDPKDPTRGWGVFGEVGVSDGNATPIGRSGYLGVGGSSLFPGRQQDRFGVAYFRYSLSQDLRAVLAPLVKVNHEAGIEAFYNAQATSWLNVSGDVQVIQPALPGLRTAVFLGLRTRIGI